MPMPLDYGFESDALHKQQNNDDMANWNNYEQCALYEIENNNLYIHDYIKQFKSATK